MMKKVSKEVHKSLLPLSISEFLTSYNQNMPVGYPRASTNLLNKFREMHPALFKRGDAWSLDQHRKKLFEWLSQNTKSSLA